MPRFFVDLPLRAGQTLLLPAQAARHVQVLRLQPGDELTVFNGQAGQWRARIETISRKEVAVAVQGFEAIEREPARRVHLALAMPANERMDWLLEKVTELGAASVHPLISAHSVLRLSGERANKKRQHWQAIVAAACEQCGGNRLPSVEGPLALEPYLLQDHPVAHKFVLSLQAQARPLTVLLQALPPDSDLLFLSGPEGGLTTEEEALAQARGFVPVRLGPRVLRAETAALCALALGLGAQ